MLDRTVPGPRLRVTGRWAARLGVVAAASTTLFAVVAPALPASAAGTIVGVDISHYQNDAGPINWSAVRADGQFFSIAKATEGQTYNDASFSTNFNSAANAGLVHGAYHFARPDTSSGDAAAEANHFVSIAGTFHGAGTLPPVLDLETSGGLSVSALTSWVQTFLNTLEAATGRVPMIYTGPSFWSTYMGNSTAFTRYPLWIAHYTSGSPTIPGGWSNYTFWQYTSSASVSGITGNVDHNRYRGTSLSLNQLALLSGVSGLVNTGGSNLNVRSGPGTSYSIVGTVADGTFVKITCQISGTSVTGTYGTSSWWDKLSTGGYIADAYVDTGSSSRVAPAC